MGVVESQKLFSDNSWETVRRKSDLAIKSWIDNEMKWRSCVVVLIGAETANRKWVQYEIEHAWKEGKGIVGIYIDSLEDSTGKQSKRGKNHLIISVLILHSTILQKTQFQRIQMR